MSSFLVAQSVSLAGLWCIVKKLHEIMLDLANCPCTSTWASNKLNSVTGLTSGLLAEKLAKVIESNRFLEGWQIICNSDLQTTGLYFSPNIAFEDNQGLPGMTFKRNDNWIANSLTFDSVKAQGGPDQCRQRLMTATATRGWEPSV